MIYKVYILIVLLSEVVFLFLIIHSWKNRAIVGARAFFVLNLVGAWGALMEILSVVSPTPETALFWFKFRFVTLALLPLTWMIFAHQYSGMRKIPKAVMALFCIIPVITQIMVWTNDYHHFWLKRDVGFVQHGFFLIADTSQRVVAPWFIVHTLYGNALLVTGVILIVRLTMRLMKPFRMQGVFIFTGTMILLAGALVPTFNLIPHLRVNPMAPSLALCSFFYFIAIFRYQFLNLVPVARDIIIDSMDECLLVINNQFKIIDINREMRQLLAEMWADRGKEFPARIIGLDIGKVVWPFGETALKYRDMINAQGEIVVTVRGAVRHYDLRIFPIADRGGTAVARAIVMYNSTARKTAEREIRMNEARLEALYRLGHRDYANELDIVHAAALDAMRLTNSGGAVFTLFDGTGGSTGLTATAGDCAHDVAGIYEECLSTGKAVIRNTINNPADAGRVMMVPYNEDGRVVAVVGMANRREPYDDLESRQMRVFAERVSEIIKKKRDEKELARALVAAEAATRAKSEFLANMSHEIRTPMNPIVGLTHLLLQTDLSERQRDYVKNIQDSAQILLGIINDILDFSKIEAGRLFLEEIDFNLDTVLQNVAGMFVRAAEAKGLDFIFNIDPALPPQMRGDPLRLQQVLINLISNAIKFTEQGNVLLRIEQVQNHRDQKRSYVQFSVADTGIGLADDDLEKLFQSFSQADTSITRKYGGTGLGLAISRNLVELMGGTITAESQPGQGSTFTFTVPFMVADGDERRTLEVPPVLAGLRTLVVDDNTLSLNILQSYCSFLGMIITAVSSGEEAVRIAGERRESPFDLVLMDWRMPGMNGIETIRELRKTKAVHDATAVVMSSAYTLDEIPLADEDLGINGFLAKPVSISMLVNTLMEVIGGRGRRFIQSVPAPGQGQPARFDGRRVLLVEDNLINQQVALEILKGAGFSVVAAGDGREAVNILKDNDFDLVLMDVQMAGMDGYEATRLIRKDPRLQEMPIIAMTAHTLTGDRERCLEAGMNDHTSKPIDVASLLKTLRRWLPSQEAAGAPVGNTAVHRGAPAALPPLQGIDTAAALARMGDNEVLFKEIVLEFCKVYRDAAKDLREFIIREDWKKAVHLAHSIKGISGNIGASALYQTSSKLEESLRKGAAVERLLESFEQDLAQVMQNRDILGAAGEKLDSGGKSDPGDLMDLFMQLQEQIARKSFSALATFTQLDLRRPGGLEAEMKSLGESIGAFNFSKADGILKAIMQKINRPEEP